MDKLFQSVEPNSAILREQIAYYYFHQSDDDQNMRSFLYYPHYKNALTIYKDSNVQLQNTYSTISKPAKNGYSFGYAKLINHAAKAEIHGKFNKIGVVFQPLGLNHFIQCDLADLIVQPITVNFNYFKETMVASLDKVYATDCMEEKVKLLDEYFLSVYNGFKNEKMIEAMDLLLNKNKKYTVDELSRELNVNRKMLLRLFRKHQTCSVIDYIKLVQFRKSITVFQEVGNRSSLTKLAHDTSYYDQSDFIHNFKKLTGFNPKSFFKDLSNIGSQDTYWTFK